jgi:hypothetical protein
MNPEQYNFEDTMLVMSTIGADKNDLISYVKSFQDKLSTAADKLSNPQFRNDMISAIRQNTAKMQADSTKGTLSVEEFQRKRQTNNLSILALNKTFISKDSLCEAIFGKNKEEAAKTFELLNNIFSFSESLLIFYTTPEKYFDFIFAFANDIDPVNLASKEWSDIEPLINFLFKVETKPTQEEDLYGDKPEEEDVESIAQNAIAISVQSASIASKIAKDDKYLIALREDEEREAALAAEKNKPLPSGRPGASNKEIYRGKVDKKDEYSQVFTPTDIYARSVNRSRSFFERIKSIPNIEDQINFLNKNLDEAAKISVTSHYAPFSIVPDQETTIELKNVEGSMQIAKSYIPFASLVNVVSNVLKSILNEFKNNLTALKAEGPDPFYKIEKIRYNSAMHIDDLALAMKLRDLSILDKIKKIRQQTGLDIPDNYADPLLFETLLKSPTSAIRKELLLAVKMIVFSGIENQSYLTSIAKKNLGEEYSKNNDILEDVLTSAADTGDYYILSKIEKFFSLDNNAKNFCIELVTGFSMSTTMKMVSAKFKGVSSTSWTYVKCPTCTKSIYYSQKYSRHYDPKIEKQEDVKPIDMDIHLPFRSDNSLITEDDLLFDEDGSDRYFYDSGDGYTWLEIKNMIASSDEEEHMKGLHLRSIALEELGAKKTRRGYDIRNVKTKCPFEEGKLPATIELAKSKNKTLAITDFTCGMSFDFNQISNATAKITPHDINVAPLKAGINPKEELNKSLDSLIKKGIIKEYEKESFEEELKRRMSGGWKNSNKIFPCPCKFDHNNKESDLSNYKFLAFPVTGIVNKSIPVGYEPPTDVGGNKLEIEDGTASYVVCGENASLSSFVRDPSDPGSIQGLFRRYYDEFKQTGSGYKIYELVNALIAFGVDFNDILPYTKYLSEYLMSKSARKISPVDNAALRDLVKFASISLGGKPPSSVTDTSSFEVLKDLKLVCPSGHRFTVESSVNFGKSHHGVSLSYSSENKQKIKNSKILSTSGIDNFNATAELMLKRQNGRFVSEISDEQAKRYFDISKWDGDIKTVSKFYFTANGKRYIFNDINNDFIWIKKKGGRLYSLELEETSDRGTTKIIDAMWTKDRGLTREASGMEDFGDEAPSAYDSSEGEEEFLSDSDEYDPDDMYGDTESSVMEKQTGQLSAMAFEKLLNTNHSGVSVILKGTLSMIKDFTDVATRLDVYGTLYSNPVIFYSEKYKNERIDYENSISSAVKKFITHVEESVSPEQQTIDSTIVDSIVKEFNDIIKNNYYNYMMMQDLRLVDILGESVSIFSEKNLYINISEAIIEATSKVLNTDKYKKQVFKDISYAVFEDASISNIKNSFEQSGAKPDIDNAMSNLGKIVKSLRISTVSKTTQGKERKGVVDLSTMQEVASEETSSLSISGLKASEYLARVYAMSSAMYMADSFIKLSNKYLSPGSENYIGYDITMGSEAIIASRDSVISTANRDGKAFIADYYLAHIPPTVPRRKAIELQSSYPPVTYIAKYEQILNRMSEDYKDILSEMNTVVSSQRYLNDALTIMREAILSKIETSNYSQDMKNVSANLVKNCMIVPPVTTINLMPGNKYDSFYEKKDKFRKLPLFRALVLKGTEGSNIVYLVANSERNVFDIVNVKSEIEPRRVVVLSRSIGSIAGAEDISSELDNESLLKNGWKLYNIPAPPGKDAFEQKIISMFYHPYTFGVDDDGNYTIPSFDSKYFYNSHVDINTSSGFSIGKFPSGSAEDPSKLYPPSNMYTHTSDSPGIIVPIDYRGSGGGIDKDWRNDQNKVFPLFNPRIPVVIPTGDNDTITVDVSDFFARDPEDLAKKYINQIYDLYAEYNSALSKIMKSVAATAETFTLSSSAKKSESSDVRRKKHKLRQEYKEKISDIYSKYRALPLLVNSSECVSLTPGKFAKNIESGRCAFVPMIDYVTINKIISIDGFSQEFGGHSLWSHGDDDYKNKVISGVRSMLISMNGLESLAKEINQKINSFECRLVLNSKPMKIPDNFIKLSVNAYDLLSPYGDPLNPEVGFYVKIYKSARQAIDSIISKNKFLAKYEPQQSEIDNLVSLISQHLVARKSIEGWKPGDDHDFYLYKSVDGSGAITTQHKQMKEKDYYSWKYNAGKHFQVASDIEESGGLPPARLCVISDVFPYDSGKSTRATDMRNIQDPDHEKILGQFDIHGSKIYRGRPDTTELFVKKEDIGAETLAGREKDLGNVKATGALNLSVGVTNAALDYITKYIASSRKFFHEGFKAPEETKKASHLRFLSKKAEKMNLSTPRPISKIAAELSNMLSIKNIAPDYYVRNISLAAIAALVSQIART